MRLGDPNASNLILRCLYRLNLQGQALQVPIQRRPAIRLPATCLRLYLTAGPCKFHAKIDLQRLLLLV